jgi:V8-like Glu-specific endopeptidase
MPPGTPTATAFLGVRTVGPLFAPGSTTHTCTASVVSSPSRNLLITAAHCLTGSAAGVTFAPDFHDGITPFGTWTVTKAYVAPAWSTGVNPARDVAFLVVAPKVINGHTTQIQALTGGNTLAKLPKVGTMITVPAYPIGTSANPITCSAPIYEQNGIPAFNCNPYVAGTSGAPWIVKTAQGSSVVGVIGGPSQGGCYPWTSYSSAFGSATFKTYTLATAGAPPSVLPSPGSDGCTTGL